MAQCGERQRVMFAAPAIKAPLLLHARKAEITAQNHQLSAYCVHRRL